jgi:hypothetical protein
VEDREAIEEEISAMEIREMTLKPRGPQLEAELWEPWRPSSPGKSQAATWHFQGPGGHRKANAKMESAAFPVGNWVGHG